MIIYHESESKNDKNKLKVVYVHLSMKCPKSFTPNFKRKTQECINLMTEKRQISFLCISFFLFFPLVSVSVSLDLCFDSVCFVVIMNI